MLWCFLYGSDYLLDRRVCRVLTDAHFLRLARRNREAGLPKLLLLRPNFNCYYGVKIQQSRTPRSNRYQKIKFLKRKQKLRKPIAAFRTVILKLDSEHSEHLGQSLNQAWFVELTEVILMISMYFIIRHTLGALVTTRPIPYLYQTLSVLRKLPLELHCVLLE